MKLLFKVNKQTLERLDDNVVASFAKNYIICVFDFDEKDWGALDKMALFTDAMGNKYVVDLGYNLKCECNIPEEVLMGNHFKVSVFAGDRMTSTQETITIQPSGYDENVDEIIHTENTAENEDVKIIYCNGDIEYRRIRVRFEDEGLIPIRLNRFEREEHPY